MYHADTQSRQNVSRTMFIMYYIYLDYINEAAGTRFYLSVTDLHKSVDVVKDI